MILPGDPILCEEQRQNEEAEEKEEDKVARVVEHADSVDSRTASENELIPAQAAGYVSHLWRSREDNGLDLLSVESFAEGPSSPFKGGVR